MRLYPSAWLGMVILLAACNPTSTQIVLPPATIPAQGIYMPEQVAVTGYGADSYEFAAAARPSYTAQQIREVAYCRASMFATEHGLSGWFIRDEVETRTPLMRQVNVIVKFYRGEKPLLVSNQNETNWCRW